MNNEVKSSIDFLSRANSDYIEYLYQRYLEDPLSLDGSWNAFFAGFELAHGNRQGASARESEIEEEPYARTSKGVYGLVNAYRHFGHFVCNLDPLGHNRTTHPFLKLSEFGLSNDDLDLEVGSGGFEGPTDGTLRDLLEKLQRTYCGTFGVEYRYISDVIQRKWLQGNMEPILNEPRLSDEDRIRILTLLIKADEFEQYLHTNFLGQKRFSIEGGDSFLPLLDTLVETGADVGVDEIVMGMAHRGRINTLAHILKKPYEMILSEFEGSIETNEGDGDVKYHNGYSCDHTTSKNQKIHISLSYNPSHLELVNPAIEGIVRAKQEHRGDADRSKVVPILVHGEAAFTGQGIVLEMLALSELKGYDTGGTIHIIINNQLGFTATPSQTRFSPYPTDVAKMIMAPVFHVNADDPEKVVHAAKLAMMYRQRFKADVLINLVCYRRYGHNESDDPFFTQPLMYKEIEKHPRVCDIYKTRLMDEDRIGGNTADEIRADIRRNLDKAREIAPEIQPHDRILSLGGLWTGMKFTHPDWNAETGVPHQTLKSIGEKATRVPAGFGLYHKLKRLNNARVKMIEGDQPMDWGCAEMLAYGSLLLEGIPVRLAGQDCERGTFSHRHAVWHDTETGDTHVPLANLDPNQAEFTVINSMLSELAVVGFEYGMSLTDPNRLVIWEAQFGDFVNNAQAMVDEFICSCEAKWKRMNGLVMLLPHGYEGQGPDHSCARLERFLSLCAEDNIQVCYPTTPAQFFHMFRRQIHRPFRKPLIVMSPKSLLRNKLSFSRAGELTKGGFRNVIPDETVAPEDTRRLIFCSGKVYYELAEKRKEYELDGVGIVRIEQLYPFPEPELRTLLKAYEGCADFRWFQEEPQNMGAWTFAAPRLRKLLKKNQKLKYHGRPEAASPATGTYQLHVLEQNRILDSVYRNGEAV